MIKKFFQLESSSGILLMAAAVMAVVIDNSPLAWLYDELLTVPFSIKLAELEISKPLLLWINDGLMAVFFLLVGLEIKREVLEGELSSPSKALLPALAAVGGIAAPSLIFAALNWGEPTIQGWAIPAATDIAFALGILAILGSRVPVSLKIFLTAVAIIDDLAAIVIIALFYTAELSLTSLGFAGVFVLGFVALNRFRVGSPVPYVLLGIMLWVSVLKSGVHATLAGVIIAFAIPMRRGDTSPLKSLEHALHPWVAFLVMPVFAFANAGVHLAELSFADLLEPLPLGIALGLFFGKQIGIFVFSWLPVRLGFARLPDGATWTHIYGASLLAGVGFTMSLFIGTLAFDSPERAAAVRIGVLTGSILSGVAGYFVLARFAPRPELPEPSEPEAVEDHPHAI